MTKTLNAYFKSVMEEGVRDSKWFKTAPEEAKAAAKIRIIGVKDIVFSGIAVKRVRPALIAECECGGEIERFCLALDGGGSYVQVFDE